ncbi:flagellar hook-length control protein FliK [Aliarcobacter faecis]|uniref:flagellar hook-length control protein FliK n=1 Tax=Aliarcobacter faecis TaxID=1564138 RepID=UPI0004BB587B|nr:flagellar hook-length control protein FliK [Aliarcobacter faecis]QKF73492.1 flagellar hook-length control protein FliK [Aliarcobacter faecis]
MLISGSAALNILLANNNKVLNDVLKEADSKVLENIIKEDPKAQTTASKVIKELFENIKDGSKSSTSIENILKNSTIFKELGNVSTNLATLSNLLEDVESSDSLAKFKPLIENLSKNIKDLDATTLKEQIKNSGVFLENKLANTQNTKIENILKDIQSLIKTIETPVSKQINEQITKILQDISNPKTSTTNQNATIQNTQNQTQTQVQVSTQTNTPTATQNLLQTQTTQNTQVQVSTQTQQTQNIVNTANQNINTNIVQANQNLTQNQVTQNFTTPTNNQIQITQNAQVQVSQTQVSTQTQQIQNIVNTVNQNTNTNIVQANQNLAQNQATQNFTSPNSTPLQITVKEPILNNPLSNSLKTLTQNLQTLSTNLNPKELENLTNLTNLTKELKTATNQASLVESKFENSSIIQTKQPILNQQNIIQNLEKNINQNINQTIQTPQNQSQVQIQNLQQNIFNAQNQQININQNLTQVNIPISQNQVQSTQAFLNQIQNQIKQSMDTPQITTQNSLNIETQSNRVNPNINQTPEEIAVKEQITKETKELLVQIRDEIAKNPTISQNKNILPVIDNLLKMQNLFIKNENIQNMLENKQLTQSLNQNNLSTFSNNFASNLSPLLNSLKESLNSLSNPNILNIQNHLSKTINKVEHIISNLESENEIKTTSKDDMKTVLLQLKEELATKTDIKSQDILKQVDKILTQIDFYQLNSLVSNSNFVYVPFFWEMLEDGSINIKKAEEDKFYCQINLTLKDFGKVDLLLGLYDKNKMDLTIYAQRDHFKVAIRDNIQDLKIALNSVNIIPVNIKLLDMKENLEDNPTSNYISNTFNQNITSGIDIKA